MTRLPEAALHRIWETHSVLTSHLLHTRRTACHGPSSRHTQSRQRPRFPACRHPHRRNDILRRRRDPHYPRTVAPPPARHRSPLQPRDPACRRGAITAECTVCPHRCRTTHFHCWSFPPFPSPPSLSTRRTVNGSSHGVPRYLQRCRDPHRMLARARLDQDTPEGPQVRTPSRPAR